MSTLVKTASKSDVGHGCTRPHARASRLATCADAPHACHVSSSPGWANLTRIPNDLTHVADSDKDDIIMT